MPDFRKLIDSDRYSFLRDNDRLADRIIILGPGGSYAYGTNREDSDIDLRGVTLQKPTDLIGLTSFEQFEDRETDTVIYSFMKIIKLLIECNPNTCEILGLPREEYVILTPIGEELIENTHLFLSKRAARSFSGYAGAQLRRMQNALARGKMEQSEKEKHIMNSVSNSLNDFNRKYNSCRYGDIKLYIDKSTTPGFETEIYTDAVYTHMPLREYKALLETLGNVVTDYDKIGKRNKKKDDNHLNKHAMHLIRLYIMAIDIFEKEEIITRRTKEHDLLMKIRNGGFMKEDGNFDAEFYDILSEYETRLNKAVRLSTLPDEPDMHAIEQFVCSVNRIAINR